MKKVILLIITIVTVFMITPIRGSSQNIKDFFFQEKQIYTLTDGKNQTETYQIQRYDKHTVYLVYTLSIKHQTIRTISIKLQFQKNRITSEFIRMTGISGSINQKSKITVLALPGKNGDNCWTNRTSKERTEYTCKYIDSLALEHRPRIVMTDLFSENRRLLSSHAACAAASAGLSLT